MASIDDVKTAFGCLSTVFPQFVAKELAALTDEIATSIQGFTDPLTALGDINVDSLVEDVATLSEGDIYNNLGRAAVGLVGQYARREGRRPCCCDGQRVPERPQPGAADPQRLE
jgi:hypothetical protein